MDTEFGESTTGSEPGLRATPGSDRPENQQQRLASTGALSMRRAVEGDACVISLYGELDLASADSFELELRHAERGEAPGVVIDLSSLEFLDSTGLRAILNALRRMQERGKQMTLLRGPRQVHRVFELTGLDATLPFAD